MRSLTVNLKMPLSFVGKSDLDAGITRSFKAIGDAIGLTLPVRTEGIEALKASYVAGLKRIEAKLGIKLPVDVNGMYGFQSNVAANFSRIDAAIGGTVIPTPTIPVSITGTPPSKGTVGQPYSFTPATADGAGTKVFELAGTLLAGLAFSTTTGAITGAPTVAGSMTELVVRVTDDTGAASTTATTVTIAAAQATSTINNTDEASTLGEAQVEGALAEFAEVDAIYADQNNQLADINDRLDALEN